jgi:hypothetical protein
MLNPVLMAAVLVLGACSRTLATPLSARTSASPQDTFDCIKRQLPALDYERTSYDDSELRISARKIDPRARRPDVQFRRVLHKLEVDVETEADGQSNIQVLARTFAEYSTQRGPTEVEETASEEVVAVARQLQQRCSS